MILEDFRGEYRFLSNYYKHPVTYEGLTYPCDEDAFQAQKCDTEEGKLKYTQIKNPVTAKMAGKREKLPEDWDEKSVTVMEGLLQAKFSSPDMASMFLSTRDAELVEGNRWHDNKWGICRCERCAGNEHHNLLGKLLMKTREELKKPESQH